MSAYPPKADMRRGRAVACASCLDPCGPRGRPSDRGVLRAGDWPWPEAAHLRSRVISTWSSAGWLWPATMNLQKGCRRNGGAKRGRKCSGGFNFEHLWMMGSDCGPFWRHVYPNRLLVGEQPHCLEAVHSRRRADGLVNPPWCSKQATTFGECRFCDGHRALQQAQSAEE